MPRLCAASPSHASLFVLRPVLLLSAMCGWSTDVIAVAMSPVAEGQHNGYRWAAAAVAVWAGATQVRHTQSKRHIIASNVCRQYACAACVDNVLHNGLGMVVGSVVGIVSDTVVEQRCVGTGVGNVAVQ